MILTVFMFTLFAAIPVIIYDSVKRAIISEEDGSLQAATTGRATLSSDARLISDDTAAKFLSKFTSFMSDPQRMVM